MRAASVDPKSTQLTPLNIPCYASSQFQTLLWMDKSLHDLVESYAEISQNCTEKRDTPAAQNWRAVCVVLFRAILASFWHRSLHFSRTFKSRVGGIAKRKQFYRKRQFTTGKFGGKARGRGIFADREIESIALWRLRFHTISLFTNWG